jgi:hypothetical protein
MTSFHGLFLATNNMTNTFKLATYNLNKQLTHSSYIIAELIRRRQTAGAIQQTAERFSMISLKEN